MEQTTNINMNDVCTCLNSLDSSKIGDVGVLAMANALMHNRTLQHLSYVCIAKLLATSKFSQ